MPQPRPGPGAGPRWPLTGAVPSSLPLPPGPEVPGAPRYPPARDSTVRAGAASGLRLSLRMVSTCCLGNCCGCFPFVDRYRSEVLLAERGVCTEAQSVISVPRFLGHLHVHVRVTLPRSRLLGQRSDLPNVSVRAERIFR